jgi:hypothetical protein
LILNHVPEDRWAIDETAVSQLDRVVRVLLATIDELVCK